MSSPNLASKLKRVIDATISLSATTVLPATALVAIYHAYTIGTPLPAGFETIAGGIGIETLGHILDKFDKDDGENVTDGEIQVAVVEAIEKYQIRERLDSLDFHDKINELFQRLDVLGTVLQIHEDSTVNRVLRGVSSYQENILSKLEDLIELNRLDRVNYSIANSQFSNRTEFVQKSVFLSYRRKDIFVAHSVYQNLRFYGYDVFFDYLSIGAGDFEQIIVENIKSRAHFIVLLTPGALDRCVDPNDWLRKEIETALEHERNVVPLMFFNFDFYAEEVVEMLRVSKLEKLGRYNGWRVEAHNVDGAMEIVRNRFLNVHLDAIIHPRSNIAEHTSKMLQDSLENAQRQVEIQRELIYLSMSALTTHHSFMTRLATVRNYIEIIRLRVQEAQPEANQQLLDFTDSAISLLKNLISDRSIQIEEKEISVGNLVDHILDRTENYFKQVPVEVDFSFDASEVPLCEDYVLVVSVDLFRNSVLYNILDNAVNAIKEKNNKGIIVLRILSEADASQRFLHIEIYDNGIGISNELQQQLFTQRVASKSGMGIGLFLANTLVERAGGKISVLSEKEKETTVTIKVPIFPKT